MLMNSTPKPKRQTTTVSSNVGKDVANGLDTAPYPPKRKIRAVCNDVSGARLMVTCFQPKWYSLNQRGCNPGHRRTRALADRPKSPPRNDVGAA
ncbi:hypothetical protein HPB50_011742 [Hyalomma asiaticum]|uniref:Uncharacterized protein n=1 Tax=Hyalomma asiaticum TaxID=266040 RepID=A0ACB7SGI9_HYAAI|nr:hypothetical protein HPB50_011742 [Hyalomma asiaticum]